MKRKKDQIIIFYSNDQRVKMSICHKGGTKMTQMVYGDLVNSKGIEWDKGCEILSRIRWQTFNHWLYGWGPDLLSSLISMEKILAAWLVSDYQCYIIKHGFGKHDLFPWASNNWFQHTTVVVQLLSHVWLFATPWTAAGQASLSFTIS